MAIKRISDLAAYDPTHGASAYFIPVDKVGGQTTKMPLSDVLTIHDTTALEDIYPILLTGQAHLERVVLIEDYDADKIALEQTIGDLTTGLTQEIDARIAAEQFYAPKNNPILTGLVTVPTRSLNDNTTAAASTEYVMRAISQITLSNAELASINASIALKADTSFVVSGLADKINAADVSVMVSDKVTSFMTTSGYVDTLNLKADKTYVDNQLALKADTSAINLLLDDKADISYVDFGLSNKADLLYVNTALSYKASSTDLDTKANAATVSAALATKADLVGGVIPVSQLPVVAFNQTYVVSSEAAMLALSATAGDVVVRTDVTKNFVLGGTGNPTILSNWIELAGGVGAVASVNGMAGNVTITKGDVGLGSVVNVDTTNPANIIQSTSYRFVTDAEKTVWNSKAPYIHAHSIVDITGLDLRLAGIESTNTNVSGRLTSVEGDVNTLISNVSSNTTNIASITTRVGDVESGVYSVTDRVDDIDNTIYDINNRLSAAEATTSALSLSVTTQASNVSTLTTDTANLTTSVSTLGDRVTEIENSGKYGIGIVNSGTTAITPSEKKRILSVWNRDSVGTKPHGYMFAFIKHESTVPVVITIEEHNTPVDPEAPTTLVKTHYTSSIVNGTSFNSVPFSMLVDYAAENQLFVFVNNISTSAGTVGVSVGKQNIG